MLTQNGSSSTKFVLWFAALPPACRRNFACVPRFYRVSKSAAAAPARPFARPSVRVRRGPPRHCFFSRSVGGGASGKCKSVFYFSLSGTSERRSSEGRPTPPQATAPVCPGTLARAVAAAAAAATSAAIDTLSLSFNLLS